jgi:hypothetical protein
MTALPPPRQHFWHRLGLAVLLWAAVVGVANIALAQEATRELLNSERIAASFGSYGIEVLETSPTVRISNLYSEEGGARVCRTFAVVLYPAMPDAALANEHSAIAAGGSIGAVFAANGWIVRKTHLGYGTRHASARLAALMSVATGATLAEHFYVLDVVRDGRAIEYAALVEIHHPAYLDAAALEAIYGPAAAPDRPALLERLRAAADDATARQAPPR